MYWAALPQYTKRCLYDYRRKVYFRQPSLYLIIGYDYLPFRFDSNDDMLSPFSDLVPAKIHSSTGNLTVNETKPIVLRCHASGYPAPNVTWKRDGRSLKSKGSGVFYIGTSSRSNSGVYYCVASNGVGQGDQIKRFVTVNCKQRERKKDSRENVF